MFVGFENTKVKKFLISWSKIERFMMEIKI